MRLLAHGRYVVAAQQSKYLYENFLTLLFLGALPTDTGLGQELTMLKG